MDPKAIAFLNIVTRAHLCNFGHMCAFSYLYESRKDKILSHKLPKMKNNSYHGDKFDKAFALGSFLLSA